MVLGAPPPQIWVLSSSQLLGQVNVTVPVILMRKLQLLKVKLCSP